MFDRGPANSSVPSDQPGMDLAGKKPARNESQSFKEPPVSRPSIRNNTLTADDSHEGLMEKQSPSFHKRW
jgi:hypothetical protein